MTPSDLRTTLSRLDLSGVALARATDQSPVTISRWLAGERKVPSWLPGWIAMYETLTAKQRAKIFS